MKATDFTNDLKTIASEFKTLYVMGCIGAHLKTENVERYLKNYAYNSRPEREKMIRESLDRGIFGFDCVCLVKSLLWGWNGNPDAPHGGAVYKSGNVPDLGADKMLLECSDISEDFSTLKLGEYLWLKGHCGIYVGDGLAVECSPKWKNGVQITAVGNLGEKQGFNTRFWTKHGFLPYVDYTEVLNSIGDESPPETAEKDNALTDDTPEKTPVYNNMEENEQNNTSKHKKRIILFFRMILKIIKKFIQIFKRQ